MVRRGEGVKGEGVKELNDLHTVLNGPLLQRNLAEFVFCKSNKVVAGNLCLTDLKAPVACVG